jgi:ubiquinone/menaquinone biosynthesis C-methylase UbiE
MRSTIIALPWKRRFSIGYQNFDGGDGNMQFSNVDASGKAAEMIGFLDDLARVLAEKKRESFVALGVQPGHSVLDVGCGTGDDVRALCELVGAGGFVAGVDFSEKMIAEATARGVPANALFMQGSACALPFDDARFDAVRAERVFQHLHPSEQHQAAGELYRVLRPGGTVALLDPDWGTLAIAASDDELTRKITQAFSDYVADAWAGRRQLQVLKRAGFTDVRVETAAVTPPYAIFASSMFDVGATQAVNAGDVTREEADRWLADVQVLQDAGELCYCAIFFTSLARRPAD